MKRYGIVLVVIFSLFFSACASLPLTLIASAEITPVGETPAELSQNISSALLDAASQLAQPADELPSSSALPYAIVDTGQSSCYDNQKVIPCSSQVDGFTGQDAQYAGAQPAYVDHGDGTVTDQVTGLMWQQDPGEKMTYADALAGADNFSLAGYDDWRLPTIKELYSLILFDGTDVSACNNGTCTATPFIDTRFFYFSYGNPEDGDRVIDSQFASSTRYVSTTMGGNETMFGVNFADGRIKGYPITAMPGQSQEKLFYVLYVRGNPAYGENEFVDQGDGTILDQATGLIWTQQDSQQAMTWEDALSYCEASSEAGYTDWRLPNIKELQSLVEYTRSPDTSASAAINPIFQISSITNEGGEMDYPYFWSSTTHADSAGHGGFGAYVSFGRALGMMRNTWMDVHGAGAQRSDPKSGSAADYPQGHGPQGDAVRVENYVRCVRGGEALPAADGVASLERPSVQVTASGSLQGAAGMEPSPGGESQPVETFVLGVQTPPQEALDACTSLQAGDACQFPTPRGLLQGICQTVQQQFTCVPSRP